jgi:ferric iron reductase protein FhuF
MGKKMSLERKIQRIEAKCTREPFSAPLKTSRFKYNCEFHEGISPFKKVNALKKYEKINDKIIWKNITCLQCK